MITGILLIMYTTLISILAIVASGSGCWLEQKLDLVAKRTLCIKGMEQTLLIIATAETVVAAFIIGMKLGILFP